MPSFGWARRPLRRGLPVPALALAALTLLLLPLPSPAAAVDARWGRIAVLSAADAAFANRTAAALASKRCYCTRHGYDYVQYEPRQLHGRTPHWQRLPAITAVLNQVRRCAESPSSAFRVRD